MRRVTSRRGAGSREPRLAALRALRELYGWNAALPATLDALGDPDLRVALPASRTLESAGEASIVGPLTDWLIRRMRRPRTPQYAAVTTAVLKTCMQFGDSESRKLLVHSSEHWPLHPSERDALNTVTDLGLGPTLSRFLSDDEQPGLLNELLARVSAEDGPVVEELESNLFNVTVDRSAASVSFVAILDSPDDGILPDVVSFDALERLRDF